MKGDYYKTKESVAEYIRLAKDVDGRELIKKLKGFLPLNCTMLELGTGPGSDWNILSNDYDVLGSDNSAEFIAYLKSTYPNGRFIELDAVSLQTDEKFDAIYSNKVLHHLNDDELRKSISKQAEILNPNGLVCHSFWKGEGDEVFKGLFVNYHSEKALNDLFEDTFEVLLLESYAEFEEGDSLLMIGRKR